MKLDKTIQFYLGIIIYVFIISLIMTIRTYTSTYELHSFLEFVVDVANAASSFVLGTVMYKQAKH
jgi:hypothetical protein